MARKSIKSLRRDELVEAAIAVIGEEGLSKATLAGIATRAGMSTALVNHYFDGKEELLLLTMRSLAALWRAELMSHLPADPTPAQRLKAIIDGCFAPRNYGKGKYDAWLQFWIMAMHEERFMRLHRMINARFWSNIRYAVRRLAPASEVDSIVNGIAALIDGFAWRYSIDPEHADLDQARRICWDYVVLRCPALTP